MIAAVIRDVVQREEVLVRRNDLMLRKRFLREISDPFEMSDESFRKYYRMPPQVARDFIELVRPFLTENALSISIEHQVLSVLSFLAGGSYQKTVSQDFNHPMSQSSFSKYLHAVVRAIIELADEFIRFPGTRDERQALSRTFEQRLGVPGMLGNIDCSLILLHTPPEDEHAFVDHNGHHSVNVQVISDMNYNIMDIRVASGSTNDMFVWEYSDARQMMYHLRNSEEIMHDEGPYYLLGDNGYTPSRVLLTPVLGAAPGSREERYTDAHCGTRCRVEQLFGVWKEIMRCINNDRSLHYTPQFAGEIVVASGIVYNYLRHAGVPLPVPPNDGHQRLAPGHHNYQMDAEYYLGLMERQRIINEYF